MGANAIAQEYQMVDSNWQASYMHGGFTYNWAYQPLVLDSNTGQLIPGQTWIPVRTSATSLSTGVEEDDKAVTEEQTTNSEELNSDSTAESADETDSTDEAVTEEQTTNSEELNSDSTTEPADKVEEVPATEELISLNVFDERTFGFRERIKSE